MSAIILPFGEHIDVKALRSTICRSLVDPPYESDTYETNPPGVAPTYTFIVFLFVLVEHLDFCALGSFGF